MLDWPGALYGELAVDMGVDIAGAGARLPPLIFEAFLADFRPDFLADFFATFLADPFFAPFFLADFFALADDFFLPAALAAPFFFLAMVIPKSHGVVKQKRTKLRPIMRACAVAGQRFLRSLAEETSRVFSPGCERRRAFVLRAATPGQE